MAIDESKLARYAVLLGKVLSEKEVEEFKGHVRSAGQCLTADRSKTDKKVLETLEAKDDCFSALEGFLDQQRLSPGDSYGYVYSRVLAGEMSERPLPICAVSLPDYVVIGELNGDQTLHFAGKKRLSQFSEVTHFHSKAVSLGVYLQCYSSDRVRSMWHYFLSHRLATHGDREGAIAASKTGLQLDPLQPLHYTSIAHLYIEMGYYEKAEEILKKVLKEVDPHFTKALLDLALIEERRNTKRHLERSLAYIDQAISGMAPAPRPWTDHSEVDAYYTNAFIQKAFVLTQLSNPRFERDGQKRDARREGALAACQEVLRIEPENHSMLQLKDKLQGISSKD